MKIEVEKGMYVRTTTGKVYKVEKVIENYGVVAIDDKVIQNQFIKSASFNIIDLVECGDYVNGFEVSIIREEEPRIVIGDYDSYIRNEIRSIVTHENFNKIKFEVVQDA